MQKEDFILREIAKIGLIMLAIRNKLLGVRENLAAPFEEQIEEIKTDFLERIDFDIDLFVNLDNNDTEEYISQFVGFNADNLTSLAQIISEIGYLNNPDLSLPYLEKAAYLYELACQKDGVYSFVRESNMEALRNKIEFLK